MSLTCFLLQMPTTLALTAMQFGNKHNFNGHLHVGRSQACCGANPQVFKCGKCGEVFTTLIDLQQHIRRHEQNNHPSFTYPGPQDIHTSSILQTTLSREDKFLQEISYSLKSQGPLTVCDSRPFHCEVCDERFMLCVDLCSHLEIHHEGEYKYHSFYLKC